MNFLISFLSVLVLLSGCGGNKGSSASPLSGEQKTEFQGFVDSMSKVTYAGFRFAQSQEPENPTTERLTPEMEMVQLLRKGSCEVKHEAPSKKGTDDFLLKISGENCPIELSVESHTRFNEGGEFTFSYDAEYQVHDGNYAAWNDVVGFSLHGNASGHARGGKNDRDMAIELNISGKVLSSRYGQVNVNIEANGELKGSQSNPQGEGELTAIIEFPSYVVALGAKTTMEDQRMKTEYTLNSEEISKEDLNRYLGALTPGQNLTGANSFLSRNPKP